MVYAAHDGHGEDWPIAGFTCRCIGDLLLQALVRTCAIEVGTIGLEDPSELLLMQDEQMIQTFTTHTPQKPLTVCVGAGSMERRLEHLDV